MKLLQKICKNCSSSFERPAYRFDKDKENFFCSVKCTNQYKKGKCFNENLGINNHIPEPKTGCWLWLGATDTGGYPIIRYEGRLEHASRVMYIIVNGIKDLDSADHLHHNMDICSSILCINPTHLVLMGRSLHSHITNKKFHFTQEQILPLYLELKSTVKVAEVLGCGQSLVQKHIRRFKRNQTWPRESIEI